MRIIPDGAKSISLVTTGDFYQQPPPMTNVYKESDTIEITDAKLNEIAMDYYSKCISKSMIRRIPFSKFFKEKLKC